jgi:hypothetical protein
MVGPEPRESAAPLGRQKGHMVDMHDPGEPPRDHDEGKFKKRPVVPRGGIEPFSQASEIPS